MEEIELKVFFDDDYHFISRVQRNISVTEFLKQLEKEFQLLFNEQVTLLGLQNQFHTDIPPLLCINKCFKHNDSAFPLRQIVSASPGKLNIQILKLPSCDLPQSSRKCVPYCMPLAQNKKCNEICHICGEVKAHSPCVGINCTRFCYSSDARKQKSQGAEFCSICLGRLRSGKFPARCMHQCIVCHRPWLVLNRQGLCRTCHALIRQEYYGDRQGFKQENIWVVGDCIDIERDSQIQEARHIGNTIMEKYKDSERIIDKIQYNTNKNRKEDEE